MKLRIITNQIMTIKNKEIFIPRASGRIQAKYFKSNQQGAPVALVLQPHPQYGGTMNNRIVYEVYNCFYKNNYCNINFLLIIPSLVSISNR